MNYKIKNCICCNSKRLISSPSFLSPFFSYKMLGFVPIVIKKGEFRDLRAGVSYYPANSIECLNCSFLFLEERFSDDQFKKYYKDYQSKSFFLERIKFEKSFKNRLLNFSDSGIIAGNFSELNEIELFIESHINLPRILLDFGSGDGKGTLFLKKKKN